MDWKPVEKLSRKLMAVRVRQVAASLDMDGLALARLSGFGASILARFGRSRLGLARRGKARLVQAVPVWLGLASPNLDWPSGRGLVRPGASGHGQSCRGVAGLDSEWPSRSVEAWPSLSRPWLVLAVPAWIGKTRRVGVWLGQTCPGRPVLAGPGGAGSDKAV